MLFVINRERVIEYLRNASDGKIDGIYDWTFTDDGFLYIFISLKGREYVYYELFNSMDEIPVEIDTHLDKRHEMFGILPDDFYQEPEPQDLSLNDKNDNLFPDLNVRIE